MSQKYPYLTETLFPEDIDAIIKMADLTPSDIPLVQSYNKYYDSGDIGSAVNILQANPQLDNKLFNAVKFNKLRDSILAVQHFFKDDVEDYIDDTKDMLMDYIDQFYYTGDYSSTKQYKKRNIVSYLYCAYICKDDCIGIDPIYAQSSASWGLIAKGIQGESGLGLTPRGSWEQPVLYYKEDWVYHKNRIWESLTQNINSEPDINNSNWKLIMNFLPLTGVTWGDLYGLGKV